MSKKRTYEDMLNLTTFRVLYEHYRNVCLNMFKWDGLPEGLEERYIERVLFDNGKALFFEDPTMKHMCLPCFQGSQLNVYNEPLSWRAIGTGYNREYPREQCVLIENNKMRTPTHDTVAFFVRKMYEAERTMDVNLTTSKAPWIFLCDEKNVYTYKSIFQKIDQNEPAIFGSKTLAQGLGTEQLLPTRTEFIGNDLMDFSHSVENKLLTFLGINNCPVDKKERLVTDEAESNDQLLATNAAVMLEARQRAAEAINKMWPDLHVTVDLRHKPEPKEPAKEENEDVS